MAFSFDLTSPKSGQTWSVDFDREPSEEDMEDAVQQLDEQWFNEQDLDSSVADQGTLASAGTALWKGLGDTGANVVGGAAKLLDAGTDVVAKYTGTKKGGLFGDVAGFTDAVTEEGNRVYPVNPANKKSATVGGGAAQGLAMLATGGAAKMVGMGGQALATVPVVMAGTQGGGQGIDTAQEIGVESPEGQLAMGLLFGGVELITEKLGGIGGKEATQRLMEIYRKPAAQMLKEAAKSIGSESVEEVIAGSAQDLLIRAFADEDPERPGFTKTGVELPKLDRKMLENRAMEALGGAAGGTVMAGVQTMNNAGKPQQPQSTEAIITSRKTGRSYDVSFEGRPTADDLDEAAEFFDAQGAAGDAELRRDVSEGVGRIKAPLREKAMKFGESALADPDAFFAAYEAQNGNLVDADEMRRMLQPADLSDGDFTSATDPIVAALSREYIRRRMARMPEGGTVAFVAGGPASGKTYARSQTPELTEGVDLVIDAPMATYANAVKAVESARAKGANVLIQYVHTPIEKATAFMLDRFQRDGRETSAGKMADMHFRAQQTVLRLARDYANAEDVSVHITDSSGAVAQGITTEALQDQAYASLDETRQRIESTLNHELDRRRQETDFWTTEREARVREGSGRTNPAGNDQGPVSQTEGGPGASSLKEWGKTSFGKRLRADDRLRESWRRTVGGQYRIETEAEWQGRANAFIDANGLEGAFTMLMDAESGLSPSDQVALGLQLLLSLDTEIRAAEELGDTERAAMLDDMLYETAEAVEITGTRLGQGVRVFGMWSRMSAEGVLRTFERKVNEARESDMELKLGGRPEDIAGQIESAAKETRDDVASEALGETPADQLAQLQAEIEQLRQQLAQATQAAQAAQQEATQAPTPADAAKAQKRAQDADKQRQKKQRELKKAEERQQKKADEAARPKKNTERKPRVLKPEDIAARILERLKLTPDQREAVAKRGKNAVRQLADEFTSGKIDAPAFTLQMQALGVSPDMTSQLLKLLQVEAEAKKTHSEPKPREPDLAGAAWRWIDKLTFKHLIGGPPEANEIGELSRIIRDYIKAPADALPDFHAQMIGLGMPPAEAVELQRMLDIERKHIADMARERAITRLVEQLTPKVTTPKTKQRMPRFLAKLFEAYDLGALQRPDFLKAYAEAFELPVMDDAMRQRITALIKAQKDAPEGFLRQQATTELMGELAKFKGISAMDIGTAFWYANVLSGLTTQGVNVWGNAFHLILRTLSIGATHNPRETWHFIRGMYEGAKRGSFEAAASLREGSVPYRGDLNFTSGQTLELIHSDNPQTWGQRWRNGLALGRFVFRALSAGDAFFYHTAREGRAWLEASRYATQQVKLNGGEFGAYLAEQLANGPQRFELALAQAEAELKASGLDSNFGYVDRRAWEIIESQRPEELTAHARRFATVATFTQQPEGSMGAVAGIINDAHRRFTLPSPWGPIRVLTPVIPFVNIVANVTSTAMDFTPVGIARGVTGRYLRHALDRSQHDFTPWEARQRVATGVLGTLGAGLAFAWAYALRGGDDDEVPFMIYGMGPPSKARRDQMPKGWKPYTLKVGDNYFSFAETPLALVFAVAGNTLDYLRYTPAGREDHAMGAATYALATSPQALLKTGVLSSVNDLFSLLEGERSWGQVVTRTASGFIPGQGLLRDISELFHGDKVDDTTLAAALLKDVPVIREIVGKPPLNIFGEPVELDTLQRLPIMKRIVTQQGEDPEALWLTRNKLWLPGMDKEIELGTYLTEQEKAKLQGVFWRSQRIGQLGRAAAGVLTTEERYEFVKKAGPGMREAVREMQRLKAEFPEARTDQLQERLNAKVVARRRIAMREVLKLQ